MIFNALIFFFALLMAPKALWQRYRGKETPSLKDRFGFNPPVSQAKKSIWVHAVSLGEMKAAAPLVHLLGPTDLLITTATATGFAEAKRSFPSAQVRYLPLDFSWTMRKWLRSFHPQKLLFIEGDLWPNLLKEAKKLQIQTALLSGKISERSTRRLQRFRFVAKRLLALDQISVQNEEYQRRFASLTTAPIHITGNLKFDIAPKPTTKRTLSRPAITLSCTHAPEEEELLTLLKPYLGDLTLFLAPRHPDRFAAVEQLLKHLQIPYTLWDHSASSGVVLVNAMGELHHCYASSRFAIVAGSFSSKVGGHNILEPCLYGCPVLFGPHTESQKEMTRLLLKSGAGLQLLSSEIPNILSEWLKNPPQQEALSLVAQCSGSAQRAYDLIK